MKKKTKPLLSFCLILILLVVNVKIGMNDENANVPVLGMSIELFTPAVQAQQTVLGGAWADVCCGAHCTPYDYCVGNGSYTCCKKIVTESE